MKIKLLRFGFVVALGIVLQIFISLPAIALEGGWVFTLLGPFELGNVNVSADDQVMELSFTDAIEISNAQATTTGFSASITTTEFIEAVEPTEFIGYTNFSIKTGAITTSQPDGVTAPLDSNYTAFSGSLSTSNAIDFMLADSRSRNAGSWTVTPTFKVTVPGLQAAGNYQATLTFALY